MVGQTSRSLESSWVSISSFDRRRSSRDAHADSASHNRRWLIRHSSVNLRLAYCSRSLIRGSAPPLSAGADETVPRPYPERGTTLERSIQLACTADTPRRMRGIQTPGRGRVPLRPGLVGAALGPAGPHCRRPTLQPARKVRAELLLARDIASQI